MYTYTHTCIYFIVWREFKLKFAQNTQQTKSVKVAQINRKQRAMGAWQQPQLLQQNQHNLKII